MNRNFLKNALSFGCLRIGIDPIGESPVICTSEGRTFICMPLSPHTEPMVEHTDVIASELEPAATPKATVTTKAVAATTPAPVAIPCKRRRRSVTPKRKTAQPTGKVELLESAEQIRNDLRNSLLQINTLIREVKAQKRQDRLLQSTMDSIRKLSLA
jgi:hypothetical protein